LGGVMDAAVAVKNDDAFGGPWALPEGWCWTKVGVVARLRGEKVAPQSLPTLPFVGMDDIAPEGTSIAQTRPFGSMKSIGNRFSAGDVLYGRLRPYLNKTAVATCDGACSGELLAICPSMAVDSRYLQLFMHARRFVNSAMRAVSGDRPRIDFATISGFDFPLAPLAEQRRIVERVNALFAEIAEGEAALAEVRNGLETFRRALLKAAVTGELTKDWRDRNPVTETGHDLIARITKVRASKDSPKVRGRRNADVSPLDTSALAKLPAGWAWARWRDVGQSQNGRPFPSGDYADFGVRLLRPGNLFVDGRVRWSTRNTRFLPEKFAESNADAWCRKNPPVQIPLASCWHGWH
jgi:type I restriction enzyme S subunit